MLCGSASGGSDKQCAALIVVVLLVIAVIAVTTIHSENKQKAVTEAASEAYHARAGVVGTNKLFERIEPGVVTNVRGVDIIASYQTVTNSDGTAYDYMFIDSSDGVVHFEDKVVLNPSLARRVGKATKKTAVGFIKGLFD
jgi:hypothetical protein